MKTLVKKNRLWLAGMILSSFVFMQCQQDENEIHPHDHQDHEEEHPKMISVPTKDLPEMVFPEPEEANSPVNDGRQVNEAERLFPASNSANGNARTQAYDFVDFNDPNALLLVPDYAKYTFASAPFYIQAVDNVWFHVKENNSTNYNPDFTSNYGHYHLGYQTFLPIFNGSNGSVWKFVNGQPVLVLVQPLQEPRTLSSHWGDQWIKIYAYDYDSNHIPFEFWGIKVIDGPIQVWMQKLDGSWSKWSSLGEATWSFDYARDVKQILISGVDSNSFTFDNIKVKMP
jgi:hypothetical protein